jgi:hypothetical protein
VARYIVRPLVRDVATAEETIKDVARAQWGEDFEFSDADPFSVLARGTALIYADLAALVTRVDEEVFRYFGRTVADVQPGEDTVATGTLTITTDANGPYEIPEDTEFSGRGANGAAVGFRTITTLTIAATETEGSVDVEALIGGTGGNGITGAAEPEEYLDFDYTAVFAAATEGGTDRESDADYLDRLATTEQLAEPKPVLTEEFATMARLLGAHRATAIHGFDPSGALNEVKTVSVNGTPTAGGSTLTFGGQTTAAIAFNADAATVKSRFEALSNVNPGDVVATGGPLPAAVTLEFTGQFRWTDVAAVTVTDSITGGDMVVTTTTAGVAPLTTEELTVALAMIDEDGEPDPDTEEIAAAIQALREQNFSVHSFEPSYTTMNATIAGVAYPGWDTAEVAAAVEEAVERFYSPAYHGLRLDHGDQREWLNRPVIRYLELAEAVQRVDGFDYFSTAPTQAKNGLAESAADVTLNGFAPLPRPGTVSVSISAP